MLRLEFDRSSPLQPAAEDGPLAVLPGIILCVGRLRCVALLDTAATWSVLRRDIMEASGMLIGDGERIRMSTRFGLVPGILVAEVPLGLWCDEGPVELTVTCFFPDDEVLPVTVGWRGFLERLSFALTPERPGMLGRIHFELRKDEA
jgi:hypothetical protein